MKTEIINSLSTIPREQWNALHGTESPFLRYEFLAALERNHCVGQALGWIPQHVVLFDDNHRLVGAVPVYIKLNSYGELVFDWSWADAYQRMGRRYYPKLVCAVPYTPVTGPRLLLAKGFEQTTIEQQLIEKVKALAIALNVSSFHWLFPTRDTLEKLLAAGYMPRLGCQFHWHNQGYKSFEDFLAKLSSRKRKNIRQERKKVHDENFQIEVITGNQANEEQLNRAHHFYSKTFDEKGGLATLTREFFFEIAQTMGEQLLLIMAKKNSHYIATAICFRDQTTLYGRHWGCDAQFDNLHFELCYYQGIHYAIEQGLQSFEPGAQGEHKISRGFLPTEVWSAHWIRDQDFSHVIRDFLQREIVHMEHYIAELSTHSPYRHAES